ncbi:RloB family protein [Brucella pseudogrignonensis]|uniref:RloB family protein n=1 Tax=Brucella pseudogrignonensis TaxID=419475 RepID=UPI0038D0B5AB
MPKKRHQADEKLPKTLNIFCEGAKTEPFYIQGYIDSFRSAQRLAVIEIQPTSKNTPVQLVEEAIKLMKSEASVPGDEYWVVYDRESIAKYAREFHAKAWDNASKAGVNIALSNVCFEHWLLLHFSDSAAQYGSFEDLKRSSALNSEVKKLTGKSYEKSAKELFQHLKPKIAEARKRAIIINKSGVDSSAIGSKPFEINPFTGMPSLLDAIDKFK